MPSNLTNLRDIRNPFEFGRELSESELVDREQELDLVERAIVNRGKFFLMGPRRFGKTSILSAVEHRVSMRRAAVVLRYDAEAYETTALLAQALLTGAARKLAGPLDRAGDTVRRLFGRLRPEVEYDLAEQKLSVTIGAAERVEELPALSKVLDGIEVMAEEASGPVAVIIDEFQQLIADHGETAEKQLRATVQKHRHVSYVFAGSKTRLLADMTGDPGRAFWKLGERHFLGPIPRPDFLAFLRRGFETYRHETSDEALVRLLDVADDVPYNVQRIAYVAWELLRVESDAPLTVEVVERALTTIITQEHPAYAQLWTSLTTPQKKVLKAVILEGGRGLTSADVLRRHGVPAATMHKTLGVLDEKGIIREDEAEASPRYRLEDPFFGAWLRHVQDSGHA
ncbi:MAG: ATP-binding protein [Gemmatimonadetes bacterium]|nr:ATP-binding protein [Gemmatimonadota bacterium]